jgi:hypothetical protein
VYSPFSSAVARSYRTSPTLIVRSSSGWKPRPLTVNVWTPVPVVQGAAFGQTVSGITVAAMAAGIAAAGATAWRATWANYPDRSTPGWPASRSLQQNRQSQASFRRRDHRSG